jgi:outer membrane protein W
MRRLIEILCVAAALSAPVAADAQLQLGVRVGGAFPAGEIQDGYPLGNLVDRTLAVGLEVGWRFWNHLTVGVHGEYGFGTLDAAVERDCDFFGATCSASTIRAGIQALYTLWPDSRIDPWVGLGFGYEWVRYTQENVAVSATLGYRGFEWVRVQAGVDFRFGRFAVGPYASYGVGVFSERSLDMTDSSTSEPVENEAEHGWLDAGVRGLFTF